MKKIYLLFFLLAIFLNSFGQATPTANIRIGNATTAFGINIPVGYTVYDAGADKYFICKTAAIGTLTLTTGSANFRQIDKSAIQAVKEGLGIDVDSTVVGTLRNPILNLDTASVSVLSRQRAANTYQTKALANGKIRVGNAAGWAAEVAVSGDAAIANTGAVTVSNAAGNMRVNGTLKIVGSANDAAPDSILTIAAGVVKTSAASLFQTSTLADGKILVGNGSNVATAVTASGDATISNAGAITVTNAAGNMRVVGTLKNVGIADDAAPDSIVTVAAGIFKRSAASLFVTTASIKTAIVEEMEVANADSAATGRYYYTLAHTPTAGTVIVQVNGSAIKLTTQYLLLTNKIRVGFSLGMYDKINVAYSY